MKSQDSSVEVFDLLCLALGLVMNWATLSPEVAVLSRIKCKIPSLCRHECSLGLSAINPTCPRFRMCVRACQCPDQKSILGCFISLHAQYTSDHQDDPPECAFLRGYTAILLGLLIKDDTFNQTIVLSSLPGTSPSDRIKSLITHCNSFLDLYNDAIPLLSSDVPGVTPEEMTHKTSDRRRARWDKRGEDIARSVIASLETL